MATTRPLYSLLAMKNPRHKVQGLIRLAYEVLQRILFCADLNVSISIENEDCA